MRGEYLHNQFLVAMPSLSDPNFAQTVTLVCEHTARGALGIGLASGERVPDREPSR